MAKVEGGRVNSEMPTRHVGLRGYVERIRTLKAAAPEGVPDEALQRLDELIRIMGTLAEHHKITEVESELLARGLRELAEEIAPAQPAVLKVPRSPDPPELTINNKVSHGIGMAIAAGGPNARKKVKGWRDNVINGHPVFPCDQGRDAMTVYLEPTGYNGV
jgi:hypothetical protein